MLESSLLAPGNVLGNRYEIIRELGRGGFGRSYLALDLNKFNEKCVLKEFAPQVRGHDELLKAKELFEREAGVLYKLQHPQIPAFRELLRVKDRGNEALLLVQNYIEGKTYLELLNLRLERQQVFTEGEIVELLHDLLPVLDYIHNLGVIHRDISPDNIIYRDSAEPTLSERDRLPVLIDFGGVKELAATVVSRYSSAKIATRIGKQGYAPDEQMIRGKVSPASDLYAVGATILTLLTGKDARTLYDPSTGKWEWQQYTNISSELNRIIDRLLQYQAHDRYQSATEVLAVLPPKNSYTFTHFTHPAPPQNPPPTAHANQISQLKTLEISPRQQPAAPPPTELPARDPQEWKKPAWLAAKVTTGLLVSILAINAAVKWVQSIDPIGAVKNQIDNTTAGIAKSIPNPLKSQPSVRERQLDLNQQLKQKNISAAKFYRQVDREFYAKHPQLNGRALTNKSEDEKLRQEWQDLAREVLAKTSKERQK